MERIVRKFRTKKAEVTVAISLRLTGTMRDSSTGEIYSAEEINEARTFNKYWDAIITGGPIPIDRPHPDLRRAAHTIRDAQQSSNNKPESDPSIQPEG